MSESLVPDPAAPASGAVAGPVPAPMLAPRFVTVMRRTRETADVVTLEIESPRDEDVSAPFAEDAALRWAGRFNMLYAFGVGEIPVSVSALGRDGARLSHTIRAVGAVSRALAGLGRGASLGVRGPFGRGWPLALAEGHDLLVIAGGIGMAPLRPVLHHALAHRPRFGRVALLYGARTPEDLLFRRELQQWRREPGLQVRVAVDRAGPDWEGDVGVVTRQLDKVRFDAPDTVAMICGPEIMIRLSALALLERGVDPARIFVSMERNMKCALGHCGHCQFGPSFVCKDGPVFPHAQVGPLLTIREL